VRAAFIAVSALSLSLISVPAVAQTQGPAPIGPSVETLQATAALRPATPPPEQSANLATVAVARAGKRTGTALMIAGAAALVTGLIIDEDVVTVAGAIAAGVGLFLYLR
jgi:hypothetical protein